jgi:uncharacterized protein YjbI with pentapeptide repeats
LTDCTFEFADLRSIEAVATDFSNSSFVGADLRGARIERCNLHGVDLYWADLAGCELIECDTSDARFPQPLHVAVGPGGFRPARVSPQPLYRIALPEQEWPDASSYPAVVGPQENGR